MQTKLQWDSRVLEAVFSELYSTAMKDKKDYLPLLFSIEGSQKDTESVDGAGGEGLMEEWGQSGNSVFYEDIDELWPKTFKHRKFSAGRVIDRDLIDDLKLSEIKNRITGLADAVYKTRQMQGAEVFNNAFAASGTDFRGRTASFVGPDGKALCASDHPYSPTDTTDVQSNSGTSPLSYDAWDSTVTSMQEWVDDKGNLMAVMPDTLIVAPYNRAKALQIAGLPSNEAKNIPGTADNTINIYNGEITVIVNPFFKNRYAWFAADSARLKQFNKWYDRRKVENGQMTDFDTEIAKYKAIGRWSYGFSNYSFLFGHNATS